MTALETPLQIGGVEVPNRLYRAPVLECAGNGEAAVDTLIDELEPTAATGVGLLFQGASIVTDRGGCAAPNMTRVHDPAFVERLERLTGAIHDHGGRIFLQLAHGGLRSMATWHAEYRRQHPDQRQLAVSRPPWQLRALDRAGLISLQPDVLSTSEVWELAEQFGRCAGYAVDAGYDGIHLSAANMSIIQQFLSPFYNRRSDEFRDGVRFLEAIHDAVREHAGNVPLVTKVPAETAAPSFVRRHLSRRDGVAIATRAAAIGYDGLVPVEVSPFWDMSIVRGAFPDRAWDASDLQDDYAAVFGSRLRARAVRLLNQLQARRFGRDPGWNADFCRAVRERVDVPVLLEGGLRTRADCDRFLGATGTTAAADAVGMARPFYAEPRLGARLLAGADALCESCNNCTVPQVTGEPGRCRTPAIVREQARLRRDGAYERTE
ncbi:NADH-dependent flavin oxidoreductase [Haloarcula japonica]|uniref:NADH-dependent flavin oxidoreductase n=1 Tax=Haloarcula japonica (strain ATCC 49778 / DSM 6131 / JCM 7785 / NBRC 101032 / NCIMB 13157 / TR-1) TaxID=1227453 RepID=M0LNE4_HALJT|nr:NADH-dependent flavin oxidoreductase [Haloarcula japonica]EMA35006.1 NADH-dependent flavin oxidoreductase [Haloarcula japonica DSM 6131]